MQVSILIAIPNFCLQLCAVMMLCGPVIWTECAHKPPFYIPFGAEKVQSENKKTQRGRISKHTTSKEALLHHMTVSTTSTRVCSEVSGFTSGRGSTRTEVHNPCTEREPAWPRACAQCKGQRKGKRGNFGVSPFKTLRRSLCRTPHNHTVNTLFILEWPRCRSENIPFPRY